MFTRIEQKRYAFFDVDDTLISVKSMLSFQDFWYQKYPDPEKEAAYRNDLTTHMQPNACWSHLNRLYYSHFSGRKESQIRQVSNLWFERMRSEMPHFYHENVLRRLKNHQARGEIPVFVSGSFTQLLEPIAIELEVQHILAINLKTIDGICTGETLAPQTIAEGKATAVRDFLAKREVLASTCFAYGDDISDLPMLKLVGTAKVVAGGRGLKSVAINNGWELINP
ncbi:HAD-IB family hydrolase [Gilvimarinus sp. SDUM040013]|uniref:HAD-IB family hydrolase n=1 Tax=Gilvimarinus gilvus TaxID=3058038 RepID=A0ABU4S1S5_9GAMM|nr:HAD-IB family hydrolase [Gilvimarinus sp. SDUM040013]MDO3384427.1 HAD-IB family hydrolase [Gilvimarinus sp. SDUM040013]MDX6851032.1 HAD-IB family hydrolase [Gilvimarinus sp. SDUM040013]